MFGKILSEVIKEKMIKSKLGKNHPEFGFALTEEQKVKISTYQLNFQNISLFDLITKSEVVYSSRFFFCKKKKKRSKSS